MKFRAEANRHKSRRVFWGLVGVDFGLGSRLHRGLTTPTIDTALKIQLATGGKIKIQDWSVECEAPKEAAA